MFQTEKYKPSPLFHPFKKLPAAAPATAKPLEEDLSTSLESLLPIPGGSGEISLAWLSLFVDVLSRTLHAAAALISYPSVPIGTDRNALSSHLDGSIALLEACNAISAAVDRLRRRHLLLRLALHFLSSSDLDAGIRVGATIKEWEEDQHKESTKHDAADLIRKLQPSDPPRGKISAVRRAIYAVEALSALVSTAVLVTIGEGREEERNLNMIHVSGGDFSWAEAFNKVAAAVARKFLARAGEVVAAEAAVRKLAAALDGDGEGKAERLKSAVEEAEKAKEDLTEGLELLSDGVSGLFRSGLSTRMTALQGFRMTPNKCNQ